MNPSTDEDDFPFARATDEQRAHEATLHRARHEKLQERRRQENARLEDAREMLAQGQPERAAKAYWALWREGVQPDVALDGLLSTMRPRVAPFDATVRGLLWFGDLDTGMPAMIAGVAMIAIHKLDFLARISDVASSLFTWTAAIVIPPLYFSWVATVLAYGLLSLRKAGRSAVPRRLQHASRAALIALSFVTVSLGAAWGSGDLVWVLEAVGAGAIAVALAGLVRIPDPVRRRVYLGWIGLSVALALAIAFAHATDDADLFASAAVLPALGSFLLALFSPTVASRLGAAPGRVHD